MKPLAAGLIAIFVAVPAAGQCVHTNRGQVSGPQSLVLFTGGWPDDTPVYDGAGMWMGSCATWVSDGGVPEIYVNMIPGGGETYASVHVYWNTGLSPIPGECGTFSGNVINIYQSTMDSQTNTAVSCGGGGYAANVAHEIGHWMGLDDEFSGGCAGQVMYQVGSGRAVTSEECEVADSQNITYADRNNGCFSLEDCRQSPILVSLDPNGRYELTDVTEGVLFDFTGTGVFAQTAWTAAGAQLAFLFADRDGNEVVSDGTELLGENWHLDPDRTFVNGFEALKSFDGTGDGIVDAADAGWWSLALWRDGNHDGVCQREEVSAVSDSLVTAFSLTYRPVHRRDRFGNEFRYQGSVRVGANWQPLYDVYLVMDPPR
ncbi:MAG TPA: hypothetical protein VGS57_13055 [Thermoanaerobaculia bacterium]|jgi:hypothetical protein|nr:hypothetical protein [Thermoanaerobaculia bacterium]